MNKVQAKCHNVGEDGDDDDDDEEEDMIMRLCH
jgi:hypothetical protein